MSSRRLRSGVTLGAIVCSLFTFGGGCLTRPIEVPEATRPNFTSQVSKQPVDKVDLLFDIDNSSSMGDKQAYLWASIPAAASGANAATTEMAPAPGVTSTDPFLYWFPGAGPVGPSPAPVTVAGTLASDLSAMITGVHEYGCGIESQLESWYRFLIQPDPYASISVDATSGTASWSGTDSTILQQRHDFLRPDSLVVVIVLSDENDSEIDVRSLGGTAVRFMDQSWAPFHGTSVCATNPDDPSCTSCGFLGAPAGEPACASDGGVYNGVDDWGYDLNLRHVHMKAKYGVDPQYPIERYVLGLTSNKVPDREGEYPSGAQSYQGLSNFNCQNPLFAASLPSGSDTSTNTLCNPISQHEWITQGTSNGAPLHYNLRVDLEYACAFPLVDSTGAPAPHQCDPNTQTPTDLSSCSCSSSGLDADHLPAVCNPSLPAGNPGTQQDFAMAYPTIRELLLARLLGNSGLVSSICPVHVTDNAAGNDPLFGYRSAMDGLSQRMRWMAPAGAATRDAAADR